MAIQEQIAAVAKSYVNVKEIKGNLGWLDKAFESAMKAVGWYRGAHWCAFFMEKTWKEAYRKYYNSSPEKLNRIMILLDKLCSGNSRQTFRNFSKSKDFATGLVPAPGAAAVWKYSGTAGHTAAAVIEVNNDEEYFLSVEGNAGDMVAIRRHRFGEKNLVGFIYPAEFCDAKPDGGRVNL